MSVQAKNVPSGKRPRMAESAWATMSLIACATVLGPLLSEATAQQAPERPLTEPPNSTVAISGEIGRDDARPKLVQAQTGFSVAEIKGEPGVELPVAVEMPKSLSSDYLIVSFRGLPEGFTFSSGFRAADNWFVAARQVQGLTLLPPTGYAGSFVLEAQLIRGQNIEPLVKSVRVSIQPKPAVAKAIGDKPVAAVPAARPTAPTPQPEQQDAARYDSAKERQLLGMARSLLGEKDIAAARLIYTRLARQGSVEATLLLAQTYDHEFLSRYDISGLEPDLDKAKYWYEVAARLGSQDASGRLLALGGR